MKIIFDSNVWQIVTRPDDFSNDHQLEAFRKINKSISEGKITAYLSETIFTIEAIRKVERQNFFSSLRPQTTTQVSALPNGMVHMRFCIGPNKDDAIDFNNRPILKKYFDDAVRLGLKIVRLPRIGGLENLEIETVRHKLKGANLERFLTIAMNVGQEIEKKGAGITEIKAIGKKYSENWFKGLKNATDEEQKIIPKAAAEWADGDSVAISIGLGCDYFCTRDQAKGAGSKSVLSSKNLKWLHEVYGFKTILPEELAVLL